MTITEWFSPVSFAQKQKDVYKHEYCNSKESFFSSEEFCRWKRGDTQVLWCHGIAGSGKTVLTSMTYEYLRSIQPPTARVGIACIYCDNQQQHTQTPENLLASLWPQLHINSSDEVPLYMEKLYRVHTQNRTRPDLGQIQLHVQCALNNLEKAYILIDGLDELSDADKQDQLVESVEAFMTSSVGSNTKLQVFFTSRLKKRLLGGLQIQITASMEEITSMVESRIKIPRSFRQTLRAKVAESPELRKEILDQVVSKANGVFLIADLHMTSLKSIMNVRDLREALRRLPDKLDQYYERACTRISRQESHLQEIAHHTITWLYLSQRQLKVNELRHALAVRAEDKTFSADSLTELVDILETCQGLVVVEEHGQIMRLLHSTTREFVRKQHDQILKGGSVYLAKTCLTYLCLDVFQGKTCDFASVKDVNFHARPGEKIASHRILSFRLQKFPFLGYAAEYWGYHANGGAELPCLNLIVAFLLSRYPLNNAHMRANDILSFATQKGRLSVVNFSVQQGAMLESKDDDYGCTALGVAVKHGLSDVVELLLRAGSNPSVEVRNSSGGRAEPQSLLQEAVTSYWIFSHRLKVMMDFHLSFSFANINDSATAQFEKKLREWLALEPEPLKLLDNPDFLSAVRDDSEHKKIINMLLNHDTDVTVLGGEGESLLHLAASSKTRVRALLDHPKLRFNPGFDVNVRDRCGRTPLHYAAVACNAEVMELMIEYGADVLATDNSGVTTLHFAVGNSRCTATALSHGCGMNISHAFLGTPLQFARSVKDLSPPPSPHVIETLERSIAQPPEAGIFETESRQSDEPTLEVDSEEYRKFFSWMIFERAESRVLCRTTIESYVKQSMQQEYLNLLASIEAKRPEKKWILVHDS
ncbi:MAG: hypothetical protein Q9171_002008 [Xanthocarpia ochracea]